MDDRTLAERARRGDRAAFSDLIRQYQDLAFRAAFLITRSTAEAEDAMQDAFLKAYAAFDRFDPERPFRPWLMRIVTNEARNRLRSERRGSHLLQKLSAQPAALSSSAAPDAEVVAAEQRELILSEIDQLPEADRLVLIYHYFLDLSANEIAEVLDTNPSTIRSRLLRARLRLREHIADSTNESANHRTTKSRTWEESSDE